MEKLNRGLTLIELLVVLAILGLATATISLNLTQNKDNLTQLKPMLAQVQAAQQWAMWKRQTVRITSKEQELSFSAEVDLAHEDWAKPIALPKGLRGQNEQIQFVASGLNPPQSLRFVADQHTIVLSTDARNRMSLQSASK